MRLALLALVLPLALAAQEKYLVTSPGQPSCPRIVEDDPTVHPGSGGDWSKGTLQTGGLEEGTADPTAVRLGEASGPPAVNGVTRSQVLLSGKPAFYPAGARAPVGAFSFTDKTGKTRSLADLKGKVVVVGFWTTACDASCRELMEMADLQPKGAKFGFEVIPVNFDTERWAKVMPFLQKNPDFFKSTQVYMPGIGEHGPSVLAKVIPALPAVFIVDRLGNLAYAGTGYEANALLPALKQVLVEKVPAAQ